MPVPAVKLVALPRAMEAVPPEVKVTPVLEIVDAVKAQPPMLAPLAVLSNTFTLLPQISKAVPDQSNLFVVPLRKDIAKLVELVCPNQIPVAPS